MPARLHDHLDRARAAASRPAALALAPVLLRQGRRVRQDTLVLPEAAGARVGEQGAGDPPLRLLVVGESTAAGVGAEHQQDALASHLAAALARRHRCRVVWQVCARTGATASAAARDLLPAVQDEQDLVVVVLGVNDVLRLRSRRHWRAALEAVLDAAEPRLAQTGEVVLAGIPDLGVFPALPRPLRTVLGWHARALDRESRAVADRRPAVSHAPAPVLTGRHLFAVDGFHPHGGAYALWAEHLADALSDRPV